MDDIKRVLAKNVRHYRSQLAISQEELSDRAEMDRTYVSGIERGKRNPTITVVARLAEALEVTAAELLAQTD